MKYNDITILLDRSGSMSSIRSDVIGGLNEFVRVQQSTPDIDIRITLIQFDDVDRQWVVFSEKKAVDIKPLTDSDFNPRGNTPLLDAMGMAIAATGERLKTKPEAERPESVIFVTMTDGVENASQEWTKTKLKETIEHQTKAYNWMFVYLGANQDAFAEGASIGVATNANFGPGGQNVRASYAATAMNVNKVARAPVKTQTDLIYTASQQAEMNK